MRLLTQWDTQQVYGGACTTIAYNILSAEVTVYAGGGAVTYIPGTPEYTYWYSLFLDLLFLKSNITSENILNGNLNTYAFNSITYC